MFDNIGSKIKMLAQVVCWIGIIASIILGIVYGFDNGAIGLLYAVGGTLLSWIGSFALYGFGQLVENSDYIAAHCLSPNKQPDNTTEKGEMKTQEQIKQEIIAKLSNK